MNLTLLPLTQEIRDVFDEEITARGGRVTDAFDDGNRLFLRSLLKPDEEVRPGDKVRGGVALRTQDNEIVLHPYVFRQVCRNGAIWAHAVDTVRIARVNFNASNEEIERTIDDLREAIGQCSSSDAFQTAVDEMSIAARTEVDNVLELLPMMTQIGSRATEFVGLILGEFSAEGDQTRFGLMNAVTAIARDVPDPETRWRLEELGGGVPAFVLPAPRPSDAYVKLTAV